ncbi:serine/threonine protein kinase, partial [Acidobacteria bacterium ACD]|nr:serine/threonine protein kinase [Acidobacteria bacterium ACD]
MALDPGTRLGPFEVVSLLGVGGMGEVYRGRDTRLGREVALKILPVHLLAERERLVRFAQEARAASNLNHPNIVTIHEVGLANGTPFIAMELVEGRSLRSLMSDGPMALRRFLDLAAQLAEGVARAHEAGLVHRDLKPENVMVTRDGFVKILDFGLAKLAAAPGTNGLPTAGDPTLTAAGMVVGSPGYMSPEQASGRPLDARSDQFSLGLVYYEMLTGRRAFQRGTAVQTLSAIIQDEAEPLQLLAPRVPAPVRWIVERCLAKDPEERWAATKDLARDLRHLARNVEALSAAESTVSPVPLQATTQLAASAVTAATAAAPVVGPESARAAAPAVAAPE